MNSESGFPVILADIGGTNARFGLLHDCAGALELFEPVKTADHVNLQSAIEEIVLSKADIKPKRLVVGFAGPVTGEQYHLTNADIAINPKEIIADLNLQSAEFMNDFPAQALGVLAIEPDQMRKIGGGEIKPKAPRIVLGPGTSFGIATIIETKAGLTILPAEGACADLGLGTGLNHQRELQIQKHLKKLNARQTIESIICGPGLENLHQAICHCDEKAEGFVKLSAAEISKAAQDGNNAAAKEAVNLFGSLLGRVAGNLAMNIMAFGGVYISGGMASKMVKSIADSDFRREFENKAPHEDLAKLVPTYFVNRELAALDGLAHYVRNREQYDLSQASVEYFAN